MEKFVAWIKAWQNLNLKHGHLTKDTSQAVIQATEVLINIIKFALEKLKVQYVLPGKFQSDCLEKRFSLYRQLSGCNYHISVQQVLESEKKIRLKSVLNLHSCRYGKVEINTEIFNNDCDNIPNNSETDECDITTFEPILITSDIYEGTFELSAIAYVCGYAIRSFKKN